MNSGRKHYDFEFVGYVLFVAIFVIQLFACVYTDDKFLVALVMTVTFILYGFYYIAGANLYLRHLFVKFEKNQYGKMVSTKKLTEKELEIIKKKNLNIGLAYILFGIMILLINLLINGI